jgi:hypothetical protein
MPVDDREQTIWGDAKIPPLSQRVVLALKKALWSLYN